VSKDPAVSVTEAVERVVSAVRNEMRLAAVTDRRNDLVRMMLPCAPPVAAPEENEARLRMAMSKLATDVASWELRIAAYQLALAVRDEEIALGNDPGW
jgi:hypothetical protein